MGTIAEMASEKNGGVAKGYGVDQERRSELLQNVAFQPPEGLAIAASFNNLKQANEVGLALLAMGCPYWIFIAEDTYWVCVNEAKVSLARHEIDAVLQLQPTARGLTASFREIRVRWWGFIVYWSVLLLCYCLLPNPIADFGGVDAVRIFSSFEFWRPATALTLHGDIVHLISNMVAGAGFMFFVCRILGNGLGWLLFWIIGSLGNLLNAWVYYPDEHFSIGASTAVFGALGLLTGLGFWMTFKQLNTGSSLPRWIVPILGGLTLLGLLGVGDERVDVAAHISGFISGAITGLALARYQVNCLRFERFMGVAFVLIVTLILGSWTLAYRSTESFLE